MIGSSVIFGPSFITDKIGAIFDTLIRPATSRVIQTVAENRQPFFTEWARSFGPAIRGIPLFFWLFFIGSIYLFNDMVKTFTRKDGIFVTSFYIIFLTALIFSRYSASSTFNGTNTISLAFFSLGFIVLVAGIGTFLIGLYRLKKKELQMRGGDPELGREVDALRDDLNDTRAQLAEMQERLDFAERLLTAGRASQDEKSK